MSELSVIVANYNNELYLEQCLDSILSQTFKSLEVIVADDSSEDKSPEIIREYEKKYPHIIKGKYNKCNNGVATNRHLAILEATGQYITTLDSDDYYYDDTKLENEMTLMFEYADRDICAFSNIVLVAQDSSFIQQCGTSDNIKQGNIINAIISRCCMIPRDFVMSKKAYLALGGYDLLLPIYEDWDLKIRLSAVHEFYYTGINGTAYRRHGSGLSSAPINEHIVVMDRIFSKNLYLVDSSVRKEISVQFAAYKKNILAEYDTFGCSTGISKKLDKFYQGIKKYFKSEKSKW